MGAPRQRDTEHAHAIDMEERQDADEAVALVDVVTVVRVDDRLEHVGDEIAVREHHTLWLAGRARRERHGTWISRRVDGGRTCGALLIERRCKARVVLDEADIAHAHTALGSSGDNHVAQRG